MVPLPPGPGLVVLVHELFLSTVKPGEGSWGRIPKRGAEEALRRFDVAAGSDLPAASSRAMIARLYSTPSSVLDVTRNFIVLATSHSAVLLVLLAFYR